MQINWQVTHWIIPPYGPKKIEQYKEKSRGKFGRAPCLLDLFTFHVQEMIETQEKRKSWGKCWESLRYTGTASEDAASFIKSFRLFLAHPDHDQKLWNNKENGRTRGKMQRKCSPGQKWGEGAAANFYQAPKLCRQVLLQTFTSGDTFLRVWDRLRSQFRCFIRRLVCWNQSEVIGQCSWEDHLQAPSQYGEGQIKSRSWAKESCFKLYTNLHNHGRMSKVYFVPMDIAVSTCLTELTKI